MLLIIYNGSYYHFFLHNLRINNQFDNANVHNEGYDKQELSLSNFIIFSNYSYIWV
jgi:hypothetical protein